ncbi:NUDIX hydrolase [Vallicoccus soli]|uniref:NUDIX hydrolase n=1 Tax=Vallicoccus soli TaxID=2339232 RepID=A0A3A3ZM78_9ACTN|nr:NUDIX hydrolase [Vallicoccus soli]RJK97715.1 NUDIX hydrolase [Vallicoccus soli]
MSDAVVLAAGAVCWRPGGPDGVEVAVVHRPRYDDWSLPKGKVDPGEHLVATALREVREETGLGVHLGRPLGATSYLALGRPKRVHYWAARVVDGAFEPNDEVDGLEWRTVQDARDRVHRESDRAVLAEFARLPVQTAPVLVLRHAKARSRKAWGGDDALRPLAPEGEEQAARLPALLAAWEPERVVSSPATRCVGTLAHLDADPELVDELSEGGLEAAPAAAPDLLERLVHDGRPALLCSHRPVLPSLVARARDLADGTPVDLGLDARPLRPGELLVLHVAKGQVLGAERQRP